MTMTANDLEHFALCQQSDRCCTRIFYHQIQVDFSYPKLILERLRHTWMTFALILRPAAAREARTIGSASINGDSSMNRCFWKRVRFFGGRSEAEFLQGGGFASEQGIIVRISVEKHSSETIQPNATRRYGS